MQAYTEKRFMHTFRCGIMRRLRIDLDDSGWVHGINGAPTDPTPVEDYAPCVISVNRLAFEQAIRELQ